MYSECIMNSLLWWSGEGPFAGCNIVMLFSTDVPCVTRGRIMGKEKALNDLIHPPSFHEWKGFCIWSLIGIYRQFRIRLWAEIPILITLLISCYSAGRRLALPRVPFRVAEEALRSFRRLPSLFKKGKTPSLHLWHWFASLPLLKVGFFSSNVSKPYRAIAL